MDGYAGWLNEVMGVDVVVGCGGLVMGGGGEDEGVVGTLYRRLCCLDKCGIGLEIDRLETDGVALTKQVGYSNTGNEMCTT